jgi:SAM-dependent methyltransferase
MGDRRLAEAWERVAGQWIAWARKPGHDSYWRFHREAFFSLVPAPGRLTLDIGCGEGRLARELKRLGHNIIAFDVAPSLVEAARVADPSMTVLVADASQLPLDDGAADLAIAFMALQDIDDMPAAIGEIARVVSPGAAFCMAVIHPINSSGAFDTEAPDARFIIDGNYYEPRFYADALERDGLQMTFTSRHWPLQAYAEALEEAGFVIEAIREIPGDARWQRLPLFLDLRARKPLG